MSKNIVICLDGTSNRVRGERNTNVVRLFGLLDLDDRSRQVAYYDPGVGTFSSPGAWTPLARTASRTAGLLFGAGLRQNLGEAYCFLMQVYEPGDELFVFGFSRGAYTARALTGMLDVFGVFRQGAENLVPYAVAEYARQQPKGRDKPDGDWRTCRSYASLFGADPRRDGHAKVHFVGLWDTVKAAGNLWRELRWPYTRQLPHARTVRHAIALDEVRRPYRTYLVSPTDPDHLIREKEQDIQQVWFPGVHSDIGGGLAEDDGPALADLSLAWITREAREVGLLVRPKRYDKVQQVPAEAATATLHRMGRWWSVLGPGRREVPAGALVHASVLARMEADPGYRPTLPADHRVVEDGWVVEVPARRA